MTIKSIPAIILAGMFFFCAYCVADALELATDLFKKNEWELCRRECRRALLENQSPAERFLLLETMAAVRTGADPAVCRRLLEGIISTNANRQATAIAAYELGRLQWQAEQPGAALESFQLAFHTTTNKTLFLHSSCAMFQLFQEHRELKKGREGLLSQITTSRSEYYAALFSATKKPDPANGPPEAPGWIIQFYRTQISPAIGDRCVLEPSCSEYFHQASCKHGLLAVPMIADRFYREPDVSNAKEDPVTMPSGQIRYRDPLENHDFWMKP